MTDVAAPYKVSGQRIGYQKDFLKTGNQPPLLPAGGLERDVIPIPDLRNSSFRWVCKKKIRKKTDKKPVLRLHYALEFLFEEIETFLDIFKVFPSREYDLA